MTTDKKMITVETTVNAPIEKVWSSWTEPAHITKWNAASDDWHTPRAENDLRAGGKFSSRMEAKDGSMGFDFGGHYTNVEEHRLIESVLGDNRTIRVEFQPLCNTTHIIETFEAENQHPAEMQQTGWQAILDNFKKYTESID